ncbi:MAG: Smr/MutS family protein [Gemmatimonadaceae bacterium]
MARRRPTREPPVNPFDRLDGPVTQTLDLHGAGAAEARTIVKRFIETAARHSPGALVHVITGKGRGSAGGAVLKPVVRGLLAGDLARLTVEWALDADGGGFLVRLR